MRPEISVLIVAWNSREELTRTLPAVLRELGEDDELIVVDNGSFDGTPEAVAATAPRARLVRMDRNAGFAAACNAGAATARGELLVILNPDATPLPGFGEAIRRPWLQGYGWTAWQALVADHGGTAVNSAGNPVHFTGIAWAGGHGRPIAEAPAGPAEVTALSGACLAIPRDAWEESGGFSEPYFLYHEDVDLSLRLRSRGCTLGIEPAAVVDHEHEFNGVHKWRCLERNRWATLIRVYPAPLLWLLAPALIVTELSLIVVSVAGGWGGQKLAATLDVLRWLPRLLRERREEQADRTVGAAQFASWLTADLDSPFIARSARALPVRLVLRAYWRAVRLLLGARERPGSRHPYLLRRKSRPPLQDKLVGGHAESNRLVG